MFTFKDAGDHIDWDLRTGQLRSARYTNERGEKVVIHRKEESRMKQIDFAKPLRLHGDEVTAMKEGVTLVRFQGNTYAVDEYGNFQKTAPCSGGPARVENVPEEPKDHLIVYQGGDGKWRIDGGGKYTKENAEMMMRSPYYAKGVAVKVPV